MNKKIRAMNIPVVFAAVLLLTGSAQAAITGITGTAFNLTARVDHISTADGGSMLLWGFADGNARAPVPGPDPDR